MKKFISLLMLVLLAMFMVGCNKDEGDKDKDGNGDEVKLDQPLKETWQGLLNNKKVYLTTVGQADIDIVQNILIAAGIEEAEYTRKELLTAGEVEASGVVLLVTGTSGKGLGSAGIDQKYEENRASAFANRASAGEITVITLHVGGSGRRGSSTDPIIKVIAPKSQLLLVVNDGNQDGLFSGIAKDNNVEISLYSKTTNIKEAFKFLFGK